ISTCIILYHFADVVAHVRSGKPHDVAEDIAAKVPAFHTIRAIANAGKHVELTRHPKSELVGLRAEHLIRRKGGRSATGLTTPMVRRIQTHERLSWLRHQTARSTMCCTFAFRC